MQAHGWLESTWGLALPFIFSCMELKLNCGRCSLNMRSRHIPSHKRRLMITSFCTSRRSVAFSVRAAAYVVQAAAKREADNRARHTSKPPTFFSFARLRTARTCCHGRGWRRSHACRRVVHALLVQAESQDSARFSRYSSCRFSSKWAFRAWRRAMKSLISHGLHACLSFVRLVRPTGLQAGAAPGAASSTWAA